MKTVTDFNVILNNNKYNIKSFLKDHPGGVNTLEKYKDKSVLEVMRKFEHSKGAYHLLNDFKLKGVNGVIVDSNLTGGVSDNGRIITNEEENRNNEEIQFMEDLEGRLDWSKPLLSQLDKIAPHYHEWVNSAVYRNCRLFQSPLLESMTYTPWYLVPVFWVPIILYLGCTQYLEHVLCGDSCTETSMSTLNYLSHIVAGVCLWTIIEYSLHRWVFHLDPGRSLTMIRIHFMIHGLHHKFPFDGLRQVFPPIPALFLATLFYIPIQYLLSYPIIKMTGGLLGYLTYDMIHFYVHHGSPVDGTYLYAMKRYHSNHHFINHDKAFGISSKVWDYVFNTFVHVRRLGFSLRW